MRQPKRKPKGFLVLLCFLVASTLERGTFGLLALAGIASFHADLSREALAFLIIDTFCSLTVDAAACGCLSIYIAVEISLALLETVAAGFFRTLC